MKKTFLKLFVALYVMTHPEKLRRQQLQLTKEFQYRL